MTINWKKKLFSKKMELVGKEGPVGFLKTDNLFSNEACGKLNEQQFIFKSKGVFEKEVSITNVSSEEVIGYIRFSEFSNKAKISFRSAENATLFMRNFWQSKWQLSSEKSYRVEYEGYQNSGKITCSEGVPEVLVLAGLFATNRIWEYTAITLLLITMMVVIF